MGTQIRPWVLAAAVLCVACGPTAPSGVALGIWGGDHIALTVTAIGASVEFDCAHGTLDAPLRLDASGHFDVAGTFVREGGPIQLGAPPNSRPARYSGVMDGRAIQLTVTLTDQPQTIGTFSLTRGATAKLVKCL